MIGKILDLVDIKIVRFSAFIGYNNEIIDVTFRSFFNMFKLN